MIEITEERVMSLDLAENFSRLTKLTTSGRTVDSKQIFWTHEDVELIPVEKIQGMPDGILTTRMHNIPRLSFVAGMNDSIVPRFDFRELCNYTRSELAVEISLNGLNTISLSRHFSPQRRLTNCFRCKAKNSINTNRICRQCKSWSAPQNFQAIRNEDAAVMHGWQVGESHSVEAITTTREEEAFISMLGKGPPEKGIGIRFFFRSRDIQFGKNQKRIAERMYAEESIFSPENISQTEREMRQIQLKGHFDGHKNEPKFLFFGAGPHGWRRRIYEPRKEEDPSEYSLALEVIIYPVLTKSLEWLQEYGWTRASGLAGKTI